VFVIEIGTVIMGVTCFGLNSGQVPCSDLIVCKLETFRI